MRAAGRGRGSALRSHSPTVQRRAVRRGCLTIRTCTPRQVLRGRFLGLHKMGFDKNVRPKMAYTNLVEQHDDLMLLVRLLAVLF